jgi:hypothetical protein
MTHRERRRLRIFPQLFRRLFGSQQITNSRMLRRDSKSAGFTSVMAEKRPGIQPSLQLSRRASGRKMSSPAGV